MEAEGVYEVDYVVNPASDDNAVALYLNGNKIAGTQHSAFCTTPLIGIELISVSNAQLPARLTLRNVRNCPIELRACPCDGSVTSSILVKLLS